MSDYHRGGYVPRIEAQAREARERWQRLARLHEGEEIIDRDGRRRAKIIRGRLVRFPMWLSRLLPRWNGKELW